MPGHIPGRGLGCFPGILLPDVKAIGVGVGIGIAIGYRHRSRDRLFSSTSGIQSRYPIAIPIPTLIAIPTPTPTPMNSGDLIILDSVQHTPGRLPAMAASRVIRHVAGVHWREPNWQDAAPAWGIPRRRPVQSGCSACRPMPRLLMPVHTRCRTRCL